MESTKPGDKAELQSTGHGYLGATGFANKKIFTYFFPSGKEDTPRSEEMTQRLTPRNFNGISMSNSPRQNLTGINYEVDSPSKFNRAYQAKVEINTDEILKQDEKDRDTQGSGVIPPMKEYTIEIEPNLETPLREKKDTPQFKLNIPSGPDNNVSDSYLIPNKGEEHNSEN